MEYDIKFDQVEDCLDVACGGYVAGMVDDGWQPVTIGANVEDGDCVGCVRIEQLRDHFVAEESAAADHEDVAEGVMFVCVG